MAEDTTDGKPPWEANVDNAAKAHENLSVAPQIAEEDAIAKATRERLEKQAADNAAAEADATKQKEANEVVVQPEGPLHVDLLRASFAVDARLKGIQSGEVEAPEPVSPTFHQPIPEGHTAPAVKWEPGK